MSKLSKSRGPAAHLAVLLAFGSAIAPAHAATQAPATKFGPVLVAESKSKSLCESAPDRVFVKYKLGSECIAYYVTSGFEDHTKAVLFFDGDASAKDYADAAGREAQLKFKHKLMDTWAAKMQVRYVYVSRVGLNGSSGDHALRRLPNETMVMDAAVDILKQRLGLTTIVIAGQSGGSTIAASLLTRGRTDIACAVLGSGAYELAALEYEFRTAHGQKITKEAIAKTVYDPSEHVDGIRPDPNRRIFILGDAADQTTAVDQQIRFTDEVEAAGHHVRFAFINAGGEHDHAAFRVTIPAAGACLNGMSDDRIMKAVRPKGGIKVSKSDGAKTASSN
jgi:pimeloyl-ACP methyl ester carboxylesterase